MRPNYSASPWAVDFLTELLSVSAEDGRGERIRRRVEDARFDWVKLITFANAHFLTVSLWPAMRRSGVWEIAPDDVRAYLTEIYNLAEDRVSRQRVQALEAISVLNGVGLKPIIMKSGADILDGAIEAAISSDLDMLAPPEQIERAADALIGAGFQKLTDGDAHSIGSFAREGDAGPIDLHHHLLDGDRVLPLGDVWGRSATRIEGERRWFRLSPADEIAHLVLHDQIQSGFHLTGTLDLKNLLRLAELMLRYDKDTDWEQLYRRMRQFGFGGALVSQVDAACRYFSAPRPDLPFASLGVNFSRIQRDLRLKNKLASGVIRRWGQLLYSLQRPQEKL